MTPATALSAARRTWLVVDGRDVSIDGDQLTIGSDAGVDLRLSGATPLHATVVLDGDRAFVTPCDGADVLVDGAAVPVYGASLEGGETLTVAGHTVLFRTEDPPESIVIVGDALRIGAALDNDVVLEHPTVDAYHAELRTGADGVRVRDLASTSGTRLNGQLISAALLAAGDELAIGHSAWRFAGGELTPLVLEDAPLRAERVTVQTGSAVLLRPTDLEVQEGEMLAIVGPSGAGKSTLLRVLAGLRQPSSGRVVMRGSDVSMRQSDLGFVAQDDAVHGLLTPREALTFAARLRLPDDSPEAAYRAAVERVLADVDLAALADQPIGTLSGGQRKRVALAQELIADPAVLLLDEPTSGFDPGLEHRMMLLMRQLATGSRSVVVVTHNVRHLDVCDRVAVMAPGGALVRIGAPEEVLAAYGVTTFEDVFDRLERVDGPLEAPSVPMAARPAAQAGRVQTRRRPLMPQAALLVRRYAMLMLRDRRNLRLLLWQAVLLSAGASLLFGSDVFASRDGVVLHAGESAQLLFLMVTMAIWFGAISAARQIVAERTVLARDLATGVRTEAYLLSKAVVLGALGAGQTALMAMIVFTLRPLHDDAAAAESVVLILLLCCWTGMAFGLVVSAFARSEDQASSFIPLVLLPQLLFGGAVVPTSQMSVVMGAASHLAAAQWGFAAAGHTIGMTSRIAADPVFSAASRYGSHFFALGLLPATIALLAFAAVSAAVLQAHLRPSFEGTWWQQLRFHVRQRTEVAP